MPCVLTSIHIAHDVDVRFRGIEHAAPELQPHDVHVLIVGRHDAPHVANFTDQHAPFRQHDLGPAGTVGWCGVHRRLKGRMAGSHWRWVKAQWLGGGFRFILNLYLG